MESESLLHSIQEDWELEGYDEDDQEHASLFEELSSSLMSFIVVEEDSVRWYMKMHIMNTVEVLSLGEFLETSDITDSLIISGSNTDSMKFVLDNSQEAKDAIDDIAKAAENLGTALQENNNAFVTPRIESPKPLYAVDTIYDREKLYHAVSYGYNKQATYNALSEIVFVNQINNQNDFNAICDDYEHNRSTYRGFRKLALHESKDSIRSQLTKLNISTESVEVFANQWKMKMTSDINETTKRNIRYKKGLDCVNQILENDVVEFNKYMDSRKEKLIHIFTSHEKTKIGIGLKGYLSFVQKKKEQFTESGKESYLGRGDNIIQHSQASFDIISEMITSEYDFGISKRYEQFILSLFDKYEILNSEFEAYHLVEKNIVEKIKSMDCEWNPGVVRYYDNLGKKGIEKASKINMIMNLFN